jgi:hypothetical protein
MLEHERTHLMPMPMPMPTPFDGYVEKPARVSSTCLVSVARNRYSVPCELFGQIDDSASRALKVNSAFGTGRWHRDRRSGSMTASWL